MNSGLFKRFESPKELLDFIVLEESKICTDIEEENAHIKNSLQNVIGPSITLNSTLLDEVNTILGNYNDTRIKWWGEFSKLCKGEEEYSRELIESFAGYCSCKIKTITPEYEQRFAEYIIDWGG